MVTKKQQSHVRKYVEGHYWRPTIYLPKTSEGPLRAFCEENDISINELVNRALEAYTGIKKSTR